MPTKNAREITLILVGVMLLVSLAFAVIVQETLRYEQPVRAIRGRVTDPMGESITMIWVDVYDNAQVRLDDSMPLIEQRKRQTKVASVQPQANGEFKIKHLPKGFYEIEFGNHGGGGLNSLSVLVNIDPDGTKDGLCVNLSIEGGGGKSHVDKCTVK